MQMDSPLKAALTLLKSEKEERRAEGTYMFVLATMGDDYWWITPNEWRRKVGISEATFHNLKTLGKIDKGTSPETLGCSRIRIFRHFNYKNQESILPFREAERIVKTQDRRKNNGRKKNSDRKPAATGSGENNVQRCKSNEAEQHLPRPEELQATGNHA
jgi:hypothetical protein